MKTATKWTLGILGAASAVGGIWWLSGRSRPMGYTPGRMPMPRRVSQTTGGGMTLSRYVSSRMSLKERIGVIQDNVFKGVSDPEMRELALNITRNCPERDGTCESRAIYDWMKQHIRYTGDVAPIKLGRNGPVEGIDYYQTGKVTVRIGGEDCDGHATLAATLLALNGITPMLRVTGQDQSDEGSHIYTGALLPKFTPKKFVAVDTTLPGSNRFGAEAPFGWAKDFDA